MAKNELSEAQQNYLKRKAKRLKHGLEEGEYVDENAFKPKEFILPIVLLAVAVVVIGFDTVFKGQIQLTSNPTFNKLFFGPGVPEMFGGALDVILAGVARVFVVIILASIIPAVTFVIARINNRTETNFYMQNWGSALAILAVPLIIAQLVMPILNEIVSGF